MNRIFPYPGLSHVSAILAPIGHAGASVVLYDQARVHGGQIGEREVARATAAQWFGDAVSESGPPSERPSSAVAVYLAALWAHHAGEKGPAVAPTRQLNAIQQLHRSVGDSTFFRGLRRYLADHRNATAAPGDFERAMSEEAGRPLDWSFSRAVGTGQ